MNTSSTSPTFPRARWWSTTRLFLWTLACGMACLDSAKAAINAISPVEGAVGTEITLTGTDFGDKRGKVFLGEESCKILSWTNTMVSCQVDKPQPAGTYDLTLQPQGSKKKNEPQVFSFFTMRQPFIYPGDPMRLVAPGDVITIEGDYFGRKTGQVGLRDTTGLTLECEVWDWSDHSITFQIPDGLTGVCILGVKNEVGIGVQRFFCTFTPLPPVAKAIRSYFIKETHENATGIFFNNELWMFYTQKDLATDKSNAIWASKFDANSGDIDTGAPDPGGSSDAQLAPIVIDHEMYLFHTGESGQIYFKKYTVVDTDDTTGKPIYGWEGSYTQVSGAGTTPVNAEVAPVWNPDEKIIELFYLYNNNIYRKVSYDKGLHWTASAPVTGLGTVSSAPSAVYWRKSDAERYVLLAFAGPTTPDTNDTSNVYAKVFPTRNGVVLSAQPLVWSPYPSSQPYIGDLGPEYIGIVFENGPLDQIDVGKMNKKTGVWQYNPLVPWLDRDVKRVPSFTVNMQPHLDLSAPLNVRYDAVAYLFWGDDAGAIGTGAWISSVEMLGYWEELPRVDEIDTSDPALFTSMFDLWQVIGIVDAPPWVLNGDSYLDSCTTALCTHSIFSLTQANATTLGYDMSVGVFVKSGDKSPVEAELTATISEKFESKHTKTVEITDTLYRSADGNILIYYLAPTFNIHHLEWINMSGKPTDIYIHKVDIVGSTLWSQKFDPRGFPWSTLGGPGQSYFGSNFPIHATSNDRARLDSYSKIQTDPVWFAGGQTWSRLGDASLKWIDETEETRETSFDVTYSLGVNIMDYVSVGTMGSFGVHVGSSSTTTLSNEVNLVAGLEHGEPFHSFRVDGYWLAPKQKSYWVPQNRYNAGDAPWFITYRVHTIDPPNAGL